MLLPTAANLFANSNAKERHPACKNNLCHVSPNILVEQVEEEN